MTYALCIEKKIDPNQTPNVLRTHQHTSKLPGLPESSRGGKKEPVHEHAYVCKCERAHVCVHESERVQPNIYSRLHTTTTCWLIREFNHVLHVFEFVCAKRRKAVEDVHLVGYEDTAQSDYIGMRERDALPLP